MSKRYRSPDGRGKNAGGGRPFKKHKPSYSHSYNSNNSSNSSYRNDHNNSGGNNSFNAWKQDKDTPTTYTDITSVFSCNQSRPYTVSIALPGSVLDNAKTPQLQSYLVSEIARIACIYCIDELVIFSESGSVRDENASNAYDDQKSDPNLFFVRLLQYLETPQYLRRKLFPMHSDFRYSGVCRPLRTAHHLNRNDISPLREGMVLKHILKSKIPKYAKNAKHVKNVKNAKEEEKEEDNPKKSKSKKKKKDKYSQAPFSSGIDGDEGDYASLCEVGMNKLCVVSKKLDENTRVTIQLEKWRRPMEISDLQRKLSQTKGNANEKDAESKQKSKQNSDGLDELDGFLDVLEDDDPERMQWKREIIEFEQEKYFYGKVMNPKAAAKKFGLYCGYTTRFAQDLGRVISETSYKSEYDLIIGTSDRGIDATRHDFNLVNSLKNSSKDSKGSNGFKHALIVFGGPKGLEKCSIDGKLCNKVNKLFDCYVNVCPSQGTRTIRTEEAILMTLTLLQPHLQRAHQSGSNATSSKK